MSWLDGTLGAVVTTGGAIVTASGVFYVVKTKVWPGLRDFVLFLTDVMGTPARPGHDAKPGLMQVVSDLVDSHAEHAAAMTDVRAQLADVRADQLDNAARLTRVEEGVTSAASAAVTANGKADHMLTDLDEVKSQLGDVVSAQTALAAEQAQIRSAVEGLRAADASTDEAGSTS